MKNLLDNRKTGISAMEFISIGLASHALCLIDSAGVLKQMKEKGFFSKEQINTFNNPHLIKAAFLALLEVQVVSVDQEGYKLTQLGRELANHIGILTVPLVGYRKFFANQLQLLHDPSSMTTQDIDFPGLALASNDFGAEELDPLLAAIFAHLYSEGIVCDLGCGGGAKLRKICRVIGSSGLGIDQSQSVIQENTERMQQKPKIEMIQGDVTALKGTWEEVTIALMSFVCHDIISFEKCSQVLRSLCKAFPHLQYLVLVDIVSPSGKVPTIMPGFDYGHGLQGVTTRTYEETHAVFEQANYHVFEEIPVPNMPNTFIWILQPLTNG